MAVFSRIPDRLRLFFAVVVVLGLLLGASAQSTQPEAPQQTPPPAAQQTQPAQQPPGPTPVTDTEPSRPITKAEAKALFKSVDEILQFVSRDTGMPIKHKVKRKLITREQVERYVAKHLESDKDAQRLEREQLVLEKFGLIPRGYDLHAEFLKLMREQVAAFYDPKTKTVNLLDWVQPELQRSVLAHELTHALQDQTIGLSQWLRAGAKDKGQLPDQQELVVEEAEAARENVSEGQAMLAMLDYTLAPSGLDVLKAPELVDAMRASMTSGTDLPVIAAAPIYLRESVYMPYTFGLDFERAVLTQRGKNAAFVGALEKPPADTLQIMQPETYLGGQTVEMIMVPELDKLIGPDYERYDFGGIGAFDIFLLTKQYDPKADVKQFYPHWRSGYYMAAHDKKAAKNEIALIFVTQWDTPEAAREFAQFYSSYTPQRYAVSPGASPAASARSDEAANLTIRWELGAQNKILIQTQGARLVVLEGFSETMTNELAPKLLLTPQK